MFGSMQSRELDTKASNTNSDRGPAKHNPWQSFNNLTTVQFLPPQPQEDNTDLIMVHVLAPFEITRQHK